MIDLWTTLTSLALLAVCFESLRLRQKSVFNAAFGILAICELLLYPGLALEGRYSGWAVDFLTLFNSFATSLYGRFLLVEGLVKIPELSSLLPKAILQMLGLFLVLAFIWWLLRPRTNSGEAANSTLA